MDKRVDEGVEGGVLGGFEAVGGGGGAGEGEDAGPEVKAVGVLPVVDCFVGVFCGPRDGCAEVDR